MKNLFRILTGQSPAPDALTAQLRQQARSIAHMPPPALRGRVFTALARINAREVDSRLPGWLALGGVATILVIAAVIGLRPRWHTSPQQGLVKSPPQLAIQPRPLPDLPVLAHLISADRVSQNPLETELRNLLTDLSRPTRTLIAILPARPKPSRDPKSSPPVPPNAADHELPIA